MYQFGLLTALLPSSSLSRPHSLVTTLEYAHKIVLVRTAAIFSFAEILLHASSTESYDITHGL